MADLRISVITPSFNQARFIERALDSVLCQRGPFELEYLVFDGGSSDGTIDILRRYGNRFSWKSEPDRGQSDAINKGFRQATGDILCWLNSDDVLLPGALAKVTEVFQANPHVEWLHGRCDIIDAHDRVIRRWISAYKDWCSRRYSFERLVTENFVSQMTVFWRRSLLDQVGYLNEDLHLAMDYEYWLRLARRSAPAYIRERIACFRWYPTSKSGSQFQDQFQEECAVARQQVPQRRWLHVVKRLKAARAVAIYRAMAIGRRALGNRE